MSDVTESFRLACRPSPLFSWPCLVTCILVFSSYRTRFQTPKEARFLRCWDKFGPPHMCPRRRTASGKEGGVFLVFEAGHSESHVNRQGEGTVLPVWAAKPSKKKNGGPVLKTAARRASCVSYKNRGKLRGHCHGPKSLSFSSRKPKEVPPGRASISIAMPCEKKRSNGPSRLK